MTISEISVEELHALGPQVSIVDVREPDEWEYAHIAGAVHVPLTTVPDRLDAFDAAPTYVICHVGGRSARACEFAAAQGRDVVNVAGGMQAWTDAGFGVTTGSVDASVTADGHDEER